MIRCGIENLNTADHVLRGARIGLMTNPSGVDSRLRSDIDIIHEKYRLNALLACEHGVRGSIQAGEHVEDAVDPVTGVTVYSCYGANCRLTGEMLNAFDVLVFDIQDAGARFYTYLYSLSYTMEACAAAGKSVVVLDRPNPLGGETVQGTLLDEKLHSFVGEYAMPTRYGLTIGEYALWVKDHLGLKLDLHIVPLSGWKRSMRYEDTGLQLVPPSPNCATMHAMQLYTGTCIFEGCNVSEGRGTVLPFEYIGAPYIDAVQLAKNMNALRLEGVMFREAYFTPQFSKYRGELCCGVQVHLTDVQRANPFEAGLLLMDMIREMHPADFAWLGDDGMQYRHIDRLLGTDDYRLGRTDARGLINRNAPLIAGWQQKNRDYRLY